MREAILELCNAVNALLRGDRQAAGIHNAEAIRLASKVEEPVMSAEAKVVKAAFAAVESKAAVSDPDPDKTPDPDPDKTPDE